MNSYAHMLCLYAGSLNWAGCQAAKPEAPAQYLRQEARPKGPAVVSFCDLFNNSNEYVGKSVTTTVRITGTKHVALIWDPACREHGADLHLSSTGAQSPSVLELERVLRQHGMEDQRWLGLFGGTWLGTQYYEHQFLPQPRLVFEVAEAHNVTRSLKIERPY